MSELVEIDLTLHQNVATEGNEAASSVDKVAESSVRAENAIEDLGNKAVRVNKKIKTAAAGAAKFTRQNNQLSFSMQQVARELPTLALSPQMFILAISNNLPILQDQIKKTRLENEALKKSGKGFTSVGKQLIKSLFSWQTALIAGITILTMYGDEITGFIKKLFDAGHQAGLTKKEISGLSDAMSQELGPSLGQLDSLFSRLTKAQKGTAEWYAAKKEIIDQYGSYLSGMDDEISKLEDVAGAYDLIREAIINTSKEKALTKFADEEYTDYVDVLNKNTSKIRKALIKKYGESEGQAYYEGISDAIAKGKNLSTELVGVVNSFSSDNPRLKLKNWKFQIAEENKVKQFILEINSAYNSLNGNITKSQQVLFGAPGESTEQFQNLQNEIDTTRQKIAELEQTKTGLLAGTIPSIDYAGDISDTEKALKEQQDKLVTLTDDADAKLAEQREKAYKSHIKRMNELSDEFEAPDYNAEQDNIMAAFEKEDDDNTNKEVSAAIAATKELDSLLLKYRNYEQKRTDIVKKYAVERAKLDSAGATEQIEVLNAEEVYNLSVLDTEAQGVTGAIGQLFRDMAGESVNSIQTVIDKGTELIAYLESGVFQTDENGNGLFGLTEAQFKDWGEAEGLTKLKEHIANIKQSTQSGLDVQNFVSGLSEAANLMQQLAKSSGDVQLEEAAEQLSVMSDLAGSILSGAASGEVVGAAVAGIMSVVALTVDAVATAKAEAKELEDFYSNWANALKLLNLQINSADYDGVFGSSEIEMAADAYAKAQEAIEAYNEALGETFEMTTSSPLGGDANLWAQETEALAQGMSALQGMSVKTKDNSGFANWLGFEDEYTSLYDLAPELWSGSIDGEFDVAAAEALLESNTQLTDEQRTQIENVIELKEAYDEAMEEVNEVLSSWLGSMASDMSDAIWDAVIEGSDAWSTWQDIGAEAIASIGKQMISELIMSSYLNNYQESLQEAFAGDNAATDIANIMAEIVDGFPAVFDTAMSATENFVDSMEAQGIDFSDSERTGSTSGVQSITQDSADELNGRATAIQGMISNVEDFSNTTSSGMTNLVGIEKEAQLQRSVIAQTLATIASNTTNMDSKLGDMKIILDNINTRGVKIRN